LAPSAAELITPAHVASLRRDGFAVVPKLFDAGEIERIARQVEELEASPEVPGSLWMYFEPSRIQPGERLLNRIENFVPFHAGLAQTLDGERLAGAVSTLFGERAVLFKDKINFKLPGGDGFEPHQDAQAGWNEYASLFITAAVALDAASRENGCLEVAYWHHRRELVGPLWEPLTEANLAGVDFVPYPMQPGDALFFDSYLPHRSGPNRTSQRRRVLYVTYNRASEGDHRARYYADKHASYPPDCEREPGIAYRYRV
jgi:hypothetical protein